MRLSQILENCSTFDDYQNYILITRAFISSKTPDAECINGVYVNRVPTWWHIPYRLIQLHRKYKFDLVHIHNPRAFWFSYPFIPRIPSILELHSLEELTFFKSKLFQLSCKLSNHIFVLSNAAKKWLVSNCRIEKDKISVLPNGINYDRFIYPKPITQPSVPLDVLTIGYIGSFYRWQGIFELVEAIPYVLERKPEVFLLLIGDGPQRQELEQRIDYLDIRSNTISLGAVPADEVAGYLKGIDIFTMLRPKSRATELTTPMKIFEVGLAGVPVLVSNRPGLLEAAGKNASNFFFIQEELKPQAVADRIVHILSEEMREERNHRALGFQEYLLSNDFSWNRTASIQHCIHNRLVDPR